MRRFPKTQSLGQPVFYRGPPVARRLSTPVTYPLAADLTHGAQAPEDESLHCLTWSLACEDPPLVLVYTVYLYRTVRVQ